MSQALPAQPDLSWYRKAAKKKLDELRADNASAQLADAQLAVAREHGCSSWRSFKRRIEQLAGGFPVLFRAIRTRDGEEIRRLLSDDPDLAQATDGNGQTALHIAAEANNSDAVELLLAAKADPKAYFQQSAHTALSWALTCRAFDSAQALLRGGVKPDLYCAAGLGDLDRVRRFFGDNGQVISNASHTGSSRVTAAGERLPRPPSDPREVISDALYFASRNGHADVVRELLTHDPDLNFRAYLGGTPLHWAHFDASREVIDLLLKAGADPALRDYEYHCTPRAFGICVAASWGFVDEFVKVLRSDPTLVNIFDGRGTPLHEASRAGHAKIVRILLDAGADQSARDSEGRTPLDLAEQKQHETVVDLLRLTR
jgi:ankyrin repeat protein